MLKTSSPPKQTTELALDRFWETVPPLWGQVRAHLRQTASEKFSISVEQFQILRLVRSGRNCVSELADAKRISRPAISQGVDALVNKKLLTRKQDRNDRRHTELALTAAGNAMLDAVFDDTRAWMRPRLSVLTSSELENVIRAMDSLKKLLD